MTASLKRAAITATGSYLPERVLTNAEIEKMVETTDEWIVRNIGIRERRIAAPGEQTSDMIVKSCRRAIESAGLGPDDVDGIITAIGHGDMPSPPVSCFVQDKLGCGRAFALDIKLACTGFVGALTVGAKFIADGTCRSVLVSGAELSSRTKINWKDRTTCVIFADGAGTVLLQPSASEAGVLSSYLRSDGSGWEAVNILAGGSVKPLTPEALERGEHCIRMDGKRVYKFAVWALPDAVRGALERAGMRLEEVDLVVPHQANANILREGAKTLGIPQEKVYINIDRVGNTIEASIPIALDEAARSGRLRDGDVVVLAAMGAGFTWGGNVIRWGK